MNESISICVATYGDRSWVDLAEARALPSAEAQGCPVLHHHGRTLHEARTDVLNGVRTEFVVYLDADDELAYGYVRNMALFDADVRVPAVQWVFPATHRETEPRLPAVARHGHVCQAECLTEGNYVTIGAAVRTDLARAAGWRDWPVNEDWDFWLRLHLAGASFEWATNAIYRGFVNPQSRHRGAKFDFKQETARRIAESCGIDYERRR